MPALRTAVALSAVWLLSLPTAVIASDSPRVHRSAPAVQSTLDTITHHYEYVLPDGWIYIFDIDNGHQLIDSIAVPTTAGTRGLSVSPTDGKMYISYGGDGGFRGNGSLLKFDLFSDTVVWKKNYSHGIDSHEMTPDGKTIYMPDGELATDGKWYIVNTTDGSETGTITTTGKGPHNTIVSRDGSRVYMGVRDPNNVGNDYFFVASTQSNAVIAQVGPFPRGIRPFTINGKGTIAFITMTGLLGFEVGNISTGAVLDTIDLTTMGFPKTPCISDNFPGNNCQTSHGISLAPDESEVYVIDSPNSYVHVFDVSQIEQGVRPRRIADIKTNHAFLGQASQCAYDCLQIGWLQHSLDGKYVYVGDCGDIIATATHTIVGYLRPLRNTRKMVEIDWKNGQPIAQSTRQGLGAVTPQSGLAAPVPTFPPDNVVGEPLTVSFQWNAVPSATTYRFQLAHDSLFTAIVADDSTLTGTTKSVAGLVDSTIYFWRLRARSGSSISPWSAVWNFSTLAAGSFNFGVLSGWNIISIPVQSGPRLLQTWFPGTAGPAFRYSGTYSQTDTLANGPGYWLRFGLAQPATFSGSLLLHDTINVTAGWNLVGAIGVALPAAMVASQPPGLVVSHFFSYTGSSYAVVDTLKPAQGFWVNVGADGKLILSSTGASTPENRVILSATDEIPPLPPGSASGPPVVLPSTFAIGQNYPNPFNPTTDIAYQLPVRSLVHLSIYNLLGERVADLVDGIEDAGYKTASWNPPASLPSGIYFYNFEASPVLEGPASIHRIGKMILLK